MNQDSTADADDPADVNVEPVGVEEMVRQERVRSIFDAREICREHRTKAKKLVSDNRPREASILFRSPIESYVREVEPLFSQTPKGRSYWTDRSFGTIELTPEHEEVPGDTDKYRLVGDDKILEEPPQGKRIEVNGLNSLFELSSPILAEFKVMAPSPRLGVKHTGRSVPVSRVMPMDILDSMFAVTNGYLSELGFGIDVQEGEQSTKIDDDLINEVEQWRRDSL